MAVHMHTGVSKYSGVREELKVILCLAVTEEKHIKLSPKLENLEDVVLGRSA